MYSCLSSCQAGLSTSLASLSALSQMHGVGPPSFSLSSKPLFSRSAHAPSTKYPCLYCYVHCNTGRVISTSIRLQLCNWYMSLACPLGMTTTAIFICYCIFREEYSLLLHEKGWNSTSIHGLIFWSKILLCILGYLCKDITLNL